MSQDHRRVPPVRRCIRRRRPRAVEQRPSRNGAGGGHEIRHGIRATLVAFAIVAWLASSASPAVARERSRCRRPHRADGGGRHRRRTYRQVVITFADSITGDPGLELAGAQPGRLLVRRTGRRGLPAVRRRARRRARTASAAPDGDNRYWAYFRAPAGTRRFTYSTCRRRSDPGARRRRRGLEVRDRDRARLRIARVTDQSGDDPRERGLAVSGARTIRTAVFAFVLGIASLALGVERGASPLRTRRASITPQ